MPASALCCAALAAWCSAWRWRTVSEGAGYRWQYGTLQQLSDACGAGWQLHADVLAHLSLATLTVLDLEWGLPLAQAALAALASFTALAELRLAVELGGQMAFAKLLPSLARMRALVHVDFEAATLPSPGKALLAAASCRSQSLPPL